MITDWVVALMGAVYGDAPPEEKLREISDVLEGLRPAWMDPVEYQIRMDHLVANGRRPGGVDRTGQVLPRRDDRRLEGSPQAGPGPIPPRAQARASECLGGRHGRPGPGGCATGSVTIGRTRPP